MIILLGIIFFHLFVIFGAKIAKQDRIPSISTFIFTAALVAYVVFMMFKMEYPSL